MDFLTNVISSATAPIEKQVTINGQSGPVYFKPLTGFQRLQLVKGRRYAMRDGKTPEITIDLEENETSQHMVVQFCVCHPSGEARFRNLEEVRKLPAHILAALYKAASEVNKEVLGEATEEGDPGEA